MGDEAGRPVLQPVGRGWTWFGRATLVLVAAGGGLKIVDVVLDPGPWPSWRAALVIVWALLLLVGSARAWVLAGRAHRPGPARPASTAAEYRAAWGMMRAGGVLTDRQRWLVATGMAQRDLRNTILPLACALLGLLGLSVSSTSVPALVTCGVGLVSVVVWSVVLWRAGRLHDAAVRIGAPPLRAGYER